MKALNVRMPDELHEALREEAHQGRVSMNSLILNALQLMREQKPRDPRLERARSLLLQIRTNAGQEPFIVRDSVGRRLDDVLHAIRQGEHDGLFDGEEA